MGWPTYLPNFFENLLLTIIISERFCIDELYNFILNNNSEMSIEYLCYKWVMD